MTFSAVNVEGTRYLEAEVRNYVTKIAHSGKHVGILNLRTLIDGAVAELKVAERGEDAPTYLCLMNLIVRDACRNTFIHVLDVSASLTDECIERTLERLTMTGPYMQHLVFRMQKDIKHLYFANMTDAAMAKLLLEIDPEPEEAI